MNPELPVTIPAVIADLVLNGARRRGVPAGELLRAIDISPALLADSAQQLPVAQFAALLQAITTRLDDEGLGLFGRKLKRGSYALLARSALKGSTLAAALDEFTRTLRLLQDDVTPRLVDDGYHARIMLRFHASADALRPIADEFLLRVLWRFASWLAGAHLHAERIEFAFQRPEYSEHYRAVFPTELVFDAPHSAIWFDSRLLRAPLRRDAVSLATYIDNALMDIVVPSIPTRFADRVRAWIHEERARSGQWPDLDATAAALHCSASSLQRHLAQDDTSFQALRDRLRRDWAVYRLQTGSLSTLALAGECGFADSASFQRAFKRWTGKTPGQIRRPHAPATARHRGT